ncbi:MAG: DUF2529 domain-containing protein [Bacillota bacterium]|nr:DUF2529 domain-containing protein [Bacillota bacterium]MDP4172109.1 DUF2529 domain-containing protein [Bacillota bacterium]
MLKMFTTQLTGLFKKIQDNGEFSLEDGARLLAQAPAGDGKIFIYGTQEMSAVAAEALNGYETLPFFRQWSEGEVSAEDRVLLFSRFSTDEDSIKIAVELTERGIPFVAVSTLVKSENEQSIVELADVHIDLALTKGLLPDDEGNRFGFPSSMAALFVYYGLKFIIQEIFEELE